MAMANHVGTIAKYRPHHQPIVNPSRELQQVHDQADRHPGRVLQQAQVQPDVGALAVAPTQASAEALAQILREAATEGPHQHLQETIVLH